MKFKFETGEVIECFDDAIAKLLRVDSRYEELNDETPKGRGKKSSKKDETPIEDNIPEDDETPIEDETPKGDETNDEVQE